LDGESAHGKASEQNNSDLLHAPSEIRTLC